tara:strand:+ start:4972 stop:5961 length:990 start_codon:yes stop_codon:yes gene_type:complete
MSKKISIDWVGGTEIQAHDTADKIIEELKNLVKKNSFIKDIWLYGNFNDQVSDLDILILYEKKIQKKKLPKIIKDNVKSGTVIYIPYSRRYDIFLFENLKIFSIRDGKKVKFKLDIKNTKYQLLSSFIEKYYERRQIFFLKKIAINDVIIRHIKSLIFSYETFYRYLSLNNEKFVKKNLFISYNNIRKKFVKKKLTKKEFNNYIIKFKKFDIKFNLFSHKILEKKFSKINIKNFSYFFLKKYIFSDNSKYHNKKVPKLFGIIYYFYASQNLALSKIIKKDFKYKQKLSINDVEFENFLYKKISFINRAYLDLKRSRFKKGMYRFTWYLN